LPFFTKKFTARKGHFTLPKRDFSPRFGRFFLSKARAKGAKNFADKKNSVYLHQKTLVINSKKPIAYRKFLLLKPYIKLKRV
jgi:hypothetical protein